MGLTMTTLKDILHALKDNGLGHMDLYINRAGELATYYGEHYCCSVDEWIECFENHEAWWTDDYGDDEVEYMHKWSDTIYNCDSELMEYEGEYGEPAGEWVWVDDTPIQYL